jgi:cupin fold WbuC family metalloprotein
MIDGVELIADSAHRPIAFVVRRASAPDATAFVTPDEASLQLGFVVYGAGGTVRRHRHRPVERQLHATNEVLVVRSGRCVLELFDDAGQPVAERELEAGDVTLLCGGGHAIRMLEDTVLLEVKQGPYTGLEEKEFF